MFRNLIKYLPIALCAIGIYSNTWAQNIKLIVVDSLTKKPISNIHLYQNNELFGFTNFNGEFEMSLNENITPNILILSHIGYHEKELLFRNLLKKFDTVLLRPRIHKLDEVLISYKGKTSKSKNNSFKAYFRGWQVENNNLKYFVDGICIYTLSNGINIKRNIIEYRFFRNDSLLKNRNKRAIEIEIGFVLPKLTSRLELERSLTMFSSSFTLNRNKKIVISDFPIILYGNQRGKYSLDSLGRISIYEYNQQRDSSYTARKLGYRQKILNEYYLIEYKLFDGVLFNSFEKKVSFRKIKHKKDELFKNVETNFEIFILDYNNLPKPTKKIKSFSKKYSYYKSHNWNDYLAKYPIPKVINKKLKNIKLATNKYKE